MKYFKEFANTYKKISFPVRNSDSNSLWTAYYGQYYDAIYALLEACENKSKSIYIENVFLPLCFLTSHYLELWVKTISENFGVGDTTDEDAILHDGHKLENLLKMLQANLLHRDEETDANMNRILCLYSKFSSIVNQSRDLSEAFRFPTTKNDFPTLSQTLSDCIEWQEFDFDYDRYCEIIEKLLCLTSVVYDKVYKDRIH